MGIRSPRRRNQAYGLGVARVTRGLDSTCFVSAARRRQRSTRPCPHQLGAGGMASPAQRAALSPRASRLPPGIARDVRGIGRSGLVWEARRRQRSARPCPHQLRACSQASTVKCAAWVPASLCLRSGITRLAHGSVPTDFAPAARRCSRSAQLWLHRVHAGCQASHARRAALARRLHASDQASPT